MEKVKIYWKSKVTGFTENGTTKLSIKDAKAEVKKLNKDFPDLKHWYEIAMNWEDLHREDLSHIPKMIEAGYTPKFSYHDEQNKRVTPDDVPHFPVNFKKGDKHVWSIRNGWQTADLPEHRYINHKSFNSLQEVIDQKF